MNKRHAFSPRLVLWKLICLLLGMLLIFLLALSAGFRYLTDRICISAPLSASSDTSLPQRLADYLDPSAIDWSRLRSDAVRQDRDTVNLLLIGQDSRQEDTAARADTVLLCSFRTGDNTLTVTSFLRDLYLPIPGHGSDRLNAAYAYGRGALLTQTLTENFGITIDGTVEVDFSRFAQVIDALGGVELTLRADEAQVINRATGSTLAEGSVLLTGEQALVYSRIRKLDADGDFSRTDRQRKVVTAIVEAYRNEGLSSLMTLLKQVLPMLSTDMSESRLLLLALKIFPTLPELTVSGQTVPAPGTYQDENINGMAVLRADMDAARSQLREAAGSS